MIDLQDGMEYKASAPENKVGADVGLEPTQEPGIQNKWKANYTPICLFESRGKAILKAALKERNKLKLSKLPPNEPVPPSLHEQKAIRAAQQVRERRRSPKNNVIFTEPVVTQQYEYEPEYDQSIELRVDRVLDETAPAKPKALGVPMVKDELDIEVKKYRNRLGRQTTLLSSSDDDDDDALYTLAQSDELDVQVSKVLESARSNAAKRSHENLEEPDEERMSDSPPSRSESSSGGLFSSPKVAKIAPYFEERPGDESSAEARAILHNRYKSANSNHRSRSASHRHSNLTSNCKLQSIGRGESLVSRPRDRATELLSYKKVSSPKVSARVMTTPRPPPQERTEPADMTSESNMDSQSHGYFGWLTTFLTNQMNKLIF